MGSLSIMNIIHIQYRVL